MCFFYSFKIQFIHFFFCVCVCISMEFRRGYQVALRWSSKLLSVTSIGVRSLTVVSGREENALNCWDELPAIHSEYLRKGLNLGPSTGQGALPSPRIR